MSTIGAPYDKNSSLWINLKMWSKLSSVWTELTLFEFCMATINNHNFFANLNKSCHVQIIFHLSRFLLLSLGDKQQPISTKLWKFSFTISLSSKSEYEPPEIRVKLNWVCFTSSNWSTETSFCRTELLWCSFDAFYSKLSLWNKIFEKKQFFLFLVASNHFYLWTRWLERIFRVSSK